MPTSTPEPVTHHRRHVKLTACDANIRVKASTTTCPFAQNVFYEYWAGGSPSSITAYSPTSGEGIDQCFDPDAYDYDCDGGSGDGPEYTGKVEVRGLRLRQRQRRHLRRWHAV